MATRRYLLHSKVFTVIACNRCTVGKKGRGSR